MMTILSLRFEHIARCLAIVRRRRWTEMDGDGGASPFVSPNELVFG